MAPTKWTSNQILDALRVAYGVAGSELVTDEWAFLTEVPLRAPRALPGWSKGVNHFTANTRTIDVLLVRTWSSGIGHRRIAVEVKVSRSDYRNETDIKRAPAEQSAHQTFYAAPAGLIDPDTLPSGWGLMEVYPDAASRMAGTGWNVGERGLVKARVRAATREPVCDMEYLTAATARRASRAEERIRRGEDDVALIPALRARIEQLAEQLERRDLALDRAKDVARVYRDMALAVQGGQVCAFCEEPVGLSSRRGVVVWKHRTREQENACLDLRTEANRLAKEAKFGTRYVRGWADPVMPLAVAQQAEDLPD